MTSDNCLRCAYSCPARVVGHLICRRYPPVSPGIALFPSVLPENWCGEFRPAVTIAEPVIDLPAVKVDTIVPDSPAQCPPAKSAKRLRTKPA